MDTINNLDSGIHASSIFYAIAPYKHFADKQIKTGQGFPSKRDIPRIHLMYMNTGTGKMNMKISLYLLQGARTEIIN